jgi:hypothetical protein
MGTAIRIAIISALGTEGCASTAIPADAATSCDATSTQDVARPHPGFCDPMGRSICTRWAQDYAGVNAVATCYGNGGGCARADRCDPNATNESMCTCGDGPACAADRFCIVGSNGRASCATPCR